MFLGSKLTTNFNESRALALGLAAVRALVSFVQRPQPSGTEIRPLLATQ